MKKTTKTKSLTIFMAAMVTVSSFSMPAYAAEIELEDTFVTEYQQTAFGSFSEGLYTVNAQLWKADKDENSMANGIIKNAAFVAAGETVDLYINVQMLTVSMGQQQISAYMKALSYKVGDTYLDAQVTARDSEDNITQIKLVLPSDTTVADVMVDSGMQGTQAARLHLDLDSAQGQVVDKTELNTLIETAVSSQKDDYTQDSYAGLETALTEAQKTTADQTALQEEVNEIIEKLTAAMDALVLKTEKEYGLKDGLYKVTAQFWKTAENAPSMSNGIVKGCTVRSENGKLKVYLDVQKLSVQMGGQTITSYMLGLSYLKGEEYVDAAVTDRDGEGNISQVEIELDKNKMLTDIKLDSGRIQDARLYLDLEHAQLQEETLPADGTYTIPVSMWHALSEQTSMGNEAIASKTADLVVKDGAANVVLSLAPVDLQGLKGYLGWLKITTPEGSADAEVLDVFDVYDSFNDKVNGTDQEMKGKAYPSRVSLPVEINKNETAVQMYIPVMEGIQAGSGTQDARLRLDWSELKVKEEPEVDFSSLNALIKKALAITNNQNTYTKNSFAALQNAIISANTVVSDKNSTQEDADRAEQELQNALNGLVKETVAPAASLKLDKSSMVLYTKGTTSMTLKVSVTGSSSAVTWKSSNTAVATVSNGKVTAKKAGKTVITATANGISKSCTVTVKAPALKLNKSKATLYLNGNKTITLKTSVTGSSQKITWKSSDKKAAVVKNGKITAKKTGNVTISATANGITKTCKITIKKQSLTLKKNSAEVKKGNTVKITAKAVPSGKITYTSSNKKIASVNSKGVVKAIKKGSTKITVNCNGVKKVFKVTVKK